MWCAPWPVVSIILFSSLSPSFCTYFKNNDYLCTAIMRIGNIDLGERPVLLAPMEDVTDIGFRLLCKRFGASMVYTEFVSAEALIRDVKSTI